MLTVSADSTIVRALALLCPEGPVEIRVLTERGMLVERFADLEAAAAFVQRHDDTARAIYALLNPFDPDRITGDAVDDGAVTRRHWLLIDVDPTRPARTNATGGEKALARAVLARVGAYLATLGFPEPIVADSGNGWHLLYLIDLPNDDAARDLIKQILIALARQFDTPEAHVDTSVYNASRITKLYGSMVRKGPHSEERPHRRSALDWVPAILAPVPLSALHAAAAPAPTPSPDPAPTDRTARMAKAREWAACQPPAIEGKTGDHHTYRICAGAAIDFDLTAEEAFAVLQDWNDRCQPPWSDAELREKIDNAGQYHTGERGSKLHYPLTEVGDAEHFASTYAGRVCFDARRSRWLLAEDSSGLWWPDAVERLRDFATATMRARQREANTLGDLEDRKRAFTWAINGESTKRLNNLLREARAQPAIRNDHLLDPWDADPWVLGVPGGVVDLRTGAPRKARPEERITLRAGIAYDPTARSPLWERTLLAIADDDPEWVAYLQRLGGYTLTGDTAQDRWFLKYGPHGREGKGTIDGAWTAALGDYALELPSAAFDLRPKGNRDFDLAYLPGKRFVLSSESGDTVHLNHDRVKQLTGGDRMRIANKNQRSFEITPVAKLWLACNKLPTVTDDSAAFWARVIVLPFRRSFEGKEDPALRGQLRHDPAHQRAILTWLVQGAVTYAREGLGPMPTCVRDATRAFRDVAWPLTPVVAEDCVEAADAQVSVGDFNAAYHRHCDRQCISNERRLGWKKVLSLMSARYEVLAVDTGSGAQRVREKRYVGLSLREPVTHGSGDAPNPGM